MPSPFEWLVSWGLVRGQALCEPGYKRGGRPQYSTWRYLRWSDRAVRLGKTMLSTAPAISVLFAFYTAIEKH
jgi:hypothetical protein